MPQYTILPLPVSARPTHWTDPFWAAANELRIGIFDPEGTDHRPDVRARMLYGPDELFVRFQVQDRYVRAAHIGYQAMVCFDSCVEVFLRPKADAAPPHGGYINFETSCGGSLHCSYIEDARRVPGGFAKFARIPLELGSRVQILHSLPQRIEEEIPGPIEWFVQLAIPFDLFEYYVGPVRPVSGTQWLGNLFKCADKCSHPHWASWASIGGTLSFHQPAFFAPIIFA